MRWLVPDNDPPATLEQAYDWPSDRWVRGCMVMAVDGSYTGPDGLSRSISSDTDRRVMAAIRRFADAYLVGARTIRAERYGPVTVRAEAARLRVAAGQATAPTLAIVSASCQFDWDNAEFRHSQHRPIILTVARSDPADRVAAQRWCDVVVVGQERVEPHTALAVLAERGLTRVTCEGGDSLLSDLVRVGALDELDVTMAPLLTAAPRPARRGPAGLEELALQHLMTEDGFLFARYLRVA